MKIIFNDATELNVQAVKLDDGYLKVLTVGNTPEQLRVLFSDAMRTQKMIVQERGQTVATYEGYTAYKWAEVRPGKIYAAAMYKPEKTPEVQAEVQQAAVLVAQIQAQALTDEQAVKVKAIYPAWSPDGVHYPVDYKVLHNDVLYKSMQAHTSQADWAPGVAPSLWAAVDSGEHAGTQEDPIPVPDTVETAGMEYERGKYYQEGDTVYLMNRQGMNDGETVILYFAPSVLVGQYFEVAR